jgi:endonuclease/exonuclease/phosphatase family metal-dependent hydrolase
MRNPRLLCTLEASATLLFLLQAVRVLFSVLFGLIYDFIFAETLAFSTLGAVMLFVVAAFLAPLAAPRRNLRPVLFATALVAALARVPLTINLPAVRLWSSVVIVAASGLYAATLLRHRPHTLPTGLLLAFAADQFLRAAGNTYDVGLRGWWLPAQAALSVATGVVGWLAFSRSQTESPAEEGIDIAGGLAIGMLLFLETSLLGFPNALARWSEVGYAVAAPLLMLVTLLPVFPSIRQGASRLLRGPLGGLSLLFLALAGLAAGRVVGGAMGLAGMLVAQFLLLLVPFGLAGPRRRERTGLALALGSLLSLVVNFAFAFTFTYAETIPAFRGLGLPVVLVAAAIACLPTLRPGLLKPETLRAEPQAEAWNLKPKLWHWGAAALMTLLTAAFAWPPAPSLKETGPIRVGTYNIHYGYNTPWQLSLEAQARTIEESGADIVMLQEVDTCRVTSYGVDDLLWLARRLRMQEAYGPALEGLSGVALLTRFPITEVDTGLLTSHLEQTAIVHARVQVGDQPLDAYGVWLGLEPEERARQLDDALATIGDASPAVFGADFNATPDSPIYARIQAAGFDDPFVAGGLDPAPTDPAIEPVKRIDFVWARGLDVRDGQVLDSLASDHRMVVVELALP